MVLIFLLTLASLIDESIQWPRIRQEQTRSEAKSEALTIEIQGVSRDCKLLEQKNSQLEIALTAAQLAEQRAEEIDARTKNALEYCRSLCGMHGTSGKALANDLTIKSGVRTFPDI